MLTGDSLVADRGPLLCRALKLLKGQSDNPMRISKLQFRKPAPGALVVLASCGAPDARPTEPRAGASIALAAKGGPPQDSVRLGMTVSDDGVLQIGSDGLGEYVNGAGGMHATIDVSGNLQITPENANSPTPPARRLDVRYPARSEEHTSELQSLRH